YMEKGKTFEAPTLDAVKAGMADADAGKTTDRAVTNRVQMITRESEGNLVYETRDRGVGAAAAAPGGEWIHRNYLTKDEETKAALRAAESPERMDRQQNNQRRGNTINQINAPATQPA